MDAEAAELADRLIGEFGSLSDLLAADRPRMEMVTGSTAAIDHLATVHEAMLLALREDVGRGPGLPSAAAVLDYLRLAISFEHIEQVRVLFFDSGHHLLRDELMWRGSIGEAPIYVREIIRRCLDIGASGLLLAHNHPSGDPRPSERDRSITRALAAAAATMEIRLHDHIIISRESWFSFRSEGLL